MAFGRVAGGGRIHGVSVRPVAPGDDGRIARLNPVAEKFESNTRIGGPVRKLLDPGRHVLQPCPLKRQGANAMMHKACSRASGPRG